MARRDFEALERRRMRAMGLFEQGETQAAVARRLGVSRTTAMRWALAWEEEGREGLRAAGRAGRKPRLSGDQLDEVEQALLEGPLALGYTTELWTLLRVAELIHRITGVRYHPGHVWRVMRRLGWSLQKPTTRAKERDEEAIQRWVKTTWPVVKKNAAHRGATIVFVDESGFSERPAVRRTWAPRGQTPVLTHRFRSWNNLSVIGALAYRARSPRRSRVFLMTHLGAVRSPQIVRFIGHLRRHIRGPVVLPWDGLHAHRSLVTRAYVEAERAWLTVHRLPAYAPELNPVEGLWAWFKGTAAANLCPDGLAPVRHPLRLGRRQLGRHPDRLRGFLHKAGLSFD